VPEVVVGRGRTAAKAKAKVAPVLVPSIDLLLIDEKQVAALLGLAPTSVCNLVSRDTTFPRPVEWELDSKRWRRADIVAYVEKLKLRRA
jgi:predicted DNA-binding transcriptional regulator AlpA